MIKQGRIKRMFTAAAAACLLAAGSAHAAKKEPFEAHKFFAGTFYLQIPTPNGGNLGVITTTNEWGTVITQVMGMFSGIPGPTGLPANGSTYHGTWKKTGPNSLRSVSVGFITDASGVVTHVGRITGYVNFVDKKTVDGEIWLEQFPCPTPLTCPNPVEEPTTIPNPPVAIPFTGQRVAKNLGDM